MATVTGYTAERMKDIEDTTVVDGTVVNDDLVLVRRDGVELVAGNVRGPAGPPGSGAPIVVPDGNLPTTGIDAGQEAIRTDKGWRYYWTGTKWLLTHPVSRGSYAVSKDFSTLVSTSYSVAADGRNQAIAPCDGVYISTYYGYFVDAENGAADHSLTIGICANNTINSGSLSANEIVKVLKHGYLSKPASGSVTARYTYYSGQSMGASLLVVPSVQVTNFHIDGQMNNTFWPENLVNL